MSAERGGAAVQDRPQHLQMQPGKPLLTALEEALSGCADHIGHLQRWPAHLRLCWGRRQSERVQRTRGGAEISRRKMKVDGGLLQIAMPQQNLDGAQVRTRFQEMGGEAVPQSVRMNLPADAGALGRLFAG